MMDQQTAKLASSLGADMSPLRTHHEPVGILTTKRVP